MINYTTVSKVIFLTSLFFAATEAIADRTLKKPMTPGGFFLGLGGSYNSLNFKQNINLVGVSNVHSGSTLVATGQARGPVDPFHNTQSTFAPEGQIGYLRFFNDNMMLWGVKFAYQYLGNTATDSNLVAGQTGALTTVSGTDTFTGHAIIDSAQTTTNQQFTLLPFIGKSFGNNYLYLGAGPVLFETESKYYGVTGYADVNGTHFDVTGKPSNFTGNNWMWGGAFQLGSVYFLNPSWFLDFNYTFAITRSSTTNYTGPYTSISGGYTTTGTLYGNVTQRIISQSAVISINTLI